MDSVEQKQTVTKKTSYQGREEKVMSPKKIAIIITLVAISATTIIFITDAIRCVPPCI